MLSSTAREVWRGGNLKISLFTIFCSSSSSSYDMIIIVIIVIVV